MSETPLAFSLVMRGAAVDVASRHRAENGMSVSRAGPPARDALLDFLVEVYFPSLPLGELVRIKRRLEAQVTPR